MGCTSSREARLDGQAAVLPRRSYSMPIRSFSGTLFKRHAGRSHLHNATLVSSTEDNCKNFKNEGMMKSANDRPEVLAEELGKAKLWSNIAQSRIPETPSVTPTNEPEVINTWELMEGLEDSVPVPEATVEQKDSNGHQWMHPSLQDSLISDFEPEFLSSFREALEDLSPQHPSFIQSSPVPELYSYHVRSQSVDVRDIWEINQVPAIVKARIREFQQKIDARIKSKKNAGKAVSCYKSPPDSKGKVVLYFTSIRGVRKTYEDCSAMGMILKGYGIRVDERDVSMHSGFKDELSDILGPSFGGNSLPTIFADGKYLGGGEELMHLHEIGELGKLLEGCERVSIGKGGIEVTCEGCADVRFIPCETCSGSCKVFVEEEYVEYFEWEQIGSFQRCPDCNENGLVRCPLCC